MATPQELVAQLRRIRGMNDNDATIAGMPGVAASAPLPQMPMGPPSSPSTSVQDPRVAQIQEIRSRLQGQMNPQPEPWWASGLKGLAQAGGITDPVKSHQVIMQNQQMDQQNKQQQIQNTMTQLDMIQKDKAQSDQSIRQQRQDSVAEMSAQQEMALRAQQIKNAQKPKFTEISPGASIANEEGQITSTAPQRPAAPKSWQKAEIEDPQHPGQPLQANYDPEGGKTYHPQTGEVIANPKPFVKPDKAPDASAKIERSYNSRNKELEDVGKPVTDGLGRVSRLVDTLNSATPIADSVTAPELMVVMAGGQGSGVRITQGEINSVLGGQSKWQQMRAALNQYNTDPEKANKILEPMRGQMRQLVGKVQEKLAKKQSIIENARQALIDSDDPKEHRQIVADAKKALAAVDSGTGTGPQNGATQVHEGFTYTFDGTQWKKGAKVGP